MPRKLTLEQHKAEKLSRTEKDGNGCWIWKGSFAGHMGYGRTNFQNKHWQAHRLFYTWYKGEIPDGMFVLHRCDVPSCVNPDHLFLGTAKSNAKDMVKKGRNKHGVGNPFKRGEDGFSAKLKEHQVLEIRGMYKPHEFGCKRIADIYGVSKFAIRQIVNRQTWTHI